MASDSFATVSSFLRAVFYKCRYRRVLYRLRKDYGKRTIKVGFLVSEVSKWKGQSLYDLMSDTDDFEVQILIYPSNHEINSNLELSSILQDKINYFISLGMNVRNIWDIYKHNCLNSEDINVDILFYQQPWDSYPTINDISKRSLTFYFPYFLVNGFNPTLGVKMSLHYLVYRQIFLNDKQIELYRPYINPLLYAGKMVGLGHPITDAFYLGKEKHSVKNYVIYAPHFSFKCDRGEGRKLPYYSSTFLEHGRFLLEFAKKHLEINWLFKPHPRLKDELVDCKVWSLEEVNEYYSEWERIGEACYDSKYIEYFLDSKAMITDCSSFLTEYSCTGKPLIRLIPEGGKTLAPANPELVDLYGSFYKVYNQMELSEYLETILIKNEDPNKEERQKFVREAHLADNYAAQNITNYIRELLKN